MTDEERAHLAALEALLLLVLERTAGGLTNWAATLHTMAEDAAHLHQAQNLAGPPGLPVPQAALEAAFERITHRARPGLRVRRPGPDFDAS